MTIGRGLQLCGQTLLRRQPESNRCSRQGLESLPRWPRPGTRRSLRLATAHARRWQQMIAVSSPHQWDGEHGYGAAPDDRH
jgi:hypothetical protein